MFRLWLWSNIGSKTLPDQGRQISAAPGRKAFFVREVTRSPATAGRHWSPPACLGLEGRHRTCYGTSSRNNGSSPWTAVRRHHVPRQGHFPLLQAGEEYFPCDGSLACAAYDSNCGLYSIVITPWQFGPPARVVKETCSLTGSLSAKGKNGDSPSFFNPFCFGYSTSARSVKQVFSVQRAYQFLPRRFKR